MKNGLLPIVLPEERIERFFELAAGEVALHLTIDLLAQTIIAPDGEIEHFEIDAFRKQCLLEGLDEISLALAHSDQVRAYERQRQLSEPWLFAQN